MAAANVEVEVLIVGGGPVGLTARALLERWGVRVLLIEKHTELSPFPRSRLVNVRSMEIFRQLGIAATVSERGFAREYGRIRFRDTLCEQDFAAAAMVGIDAPIAESPVIGTITSQDRLEPTLIAAARTPVRFGVELMELAVDDDGVTAWLVERRAGIRTQVRARYLLAADGANSTVRQGLDIGTTGPGTMAELTTVVFDADLRDCCAAHPAGLYFTAYGTVAPLYPEGGWAWFGRTPANPLRTDWAAHVLRALGPRIDAKVEVLRVQHWVMNAFVAERFRHGRILLAGDAAHAVPVTGGMGMNAGIADVHNLCWKLAGVLRGWAGPELLETYEPERLPVAQRTLRQAVANARLAFDVQDKRGEQLRSREPTPEHVELPWSERFFAQLGLVLGVSYRSAAVLGVTGAAPDPGTDYLPTAGPGDRLPHRWLGPGRSTLDTLGEWFTLLAPEPARWTQTDSAPWPLHVETLPGAHAISYALEPEEALLVRPDGHIAARLRNRGPHEVTAALAAVTRSAP